jgi:hypothetical protein
MRVHKVKSARKDQGTCGKCGKTIAIGDGYVWWKFRFVGKRIRCAAPACYPKAQDLTQSEWISRLADFDDARAEITSAFYSDPEDAASAIESLAEELREFGEEQSDKISNMPDALQDSDTGQLLQERADAMSTAADELEDVASTLRSLDIVDTSDDQAVRDNAGDEYDPEDGSEEEWLEDMRTQAEEANAEQIADALAEIENVCYE